MFIDGNHFGNKILFRKTIMTTVKVGKDPTRGNSHIRNLWILNPSKRKWKGNYKVIRVSKLEKTTIGTNNEKPSHVEIDHRKKR